MNDRFERGVAAIDRLAGDHAAIFDPVADIAPDLSRYVAEFAYVGFPRTVNAIGDAREVFAERGLLPVGR